MKTYRVGISGSGFGATCHLPALLAHPRFVPVAIASPTSAERIAHERGLQSFADTPTMVAQCELDAVVVASPPFAHRTEVLAALEGRKHVLCEKPFALNIEEAQQMVAAAKTAGTACGVSHEFRFVPQRIALREMVEHHHLDPLREIEITHYRSMLVASATRPRGWWFEKSRGGGLAGAILSHLIDSASWTVGREPVNALGMLRTANPQRHDDAGAFASTVDDGAFALIDYGDGLIARLTADATTAVESFTIAVHGEKRTAVASGPSLDEMTLFSVDAEETDELQCAQSPYAKFASINGNVPLLMSLYDEWVKQIETQTSALPTFEEALATQRVLTAIGYSTEAFDPTTGSALKSN